MDKSWLSCRCRHKQQPPHNYSFKDNVGTAGTYWSRLKQIDHDGAFTYSQQVQVAVGGAPRVFGLSQNFPNPFNPSTNMQFTVPTDGKATLKVYNALGQLVATLFDGVATAGQYNQGTFDASRLATGIYFARLEFGGKMQMKNVVVEVRFITDSSEMLQLFYNQFFRLKLRQKRRVHLLESKSHFFTFHNL